MTKFCTVIFGRAFCKGISHIPHSSGAGPQRSQILLELHLGPHHLTYRTWMLIHTTHVQKRSLNGLTIPPIQMFFAMTVKVYQISVNFGIYHQCSIECWTCAFRLSTSPDVCTHCGTLWCCERENCGKIL